MAKRYFQDTFKCKFCDSNNVVLYGTHEGNQRFFCRDCRRKFANNNALPKKKSPVTHVSSVLHQYYNGLSENEICHNIEQQYGYKIANSTVYRWVSEFTVKAMKATQDIHPLVGDKWVAIETACKVNGKLFWIWDIIDTETLFLLASRIITTRVAKEAIALVDLAKERASKIPQIIFADSLLTHMDGIEQTHISNTSDKSGSLFEIQNNAYQVEHFQNLLSERTKVLMVLKKQETARRFIDGWLIHYNYFRPNLSEVLNGKTPAEAAGIKLEYKDWLSLIDLPLIKLALV